LCDHYYTCEEVEKMKLTCCTKCEEYTDCHGEAKAAGRRVDDEDEDEEEPEDDLDEEEDDFDDDEEDDFDDEDDLEDEEDEEE
jgi:hypothetical protein